MGGIAFWRGRMPAVYILLTLAALLALAGIVTPGKLTPIHRGWMGLARAISKVTTPIVMGAIYYLVLTPVGWLRRALGGHALRHARHDSSGYWVIREPSQQRSDLTRQF